MGRPLRVCIPNITYHVYSRCINSENLIESDVFKDEFLEIIEKSIEKYNFSLITYTILHNHFHLMIKTLEGGGTISEIMQYIKSRFAKMYNKINNRTGPFWNERFGDKIIETSENPLEYFLNLLWYIAFNPVRKKYVSDPEEYKYSSIKAYTSEEFTGEIAITHHSFFLTLGATIKESIYKVIEYGKSYKEDIFEKLN